LCGIFSAISVLLTTENSKNNHFVFESGSSNVRPQQ